MTIKHDAEWLARHSHIRNVKQIRHTIPYVPEQFSINPLTSEEMVAMEKRLRNMVYVTTDENLTAFKNSLCRCNECEKTPALIIDSAAQLDKE